MAIFDSTWYLKDNGTVGWSAVTQWAALTAYTAGQTRRQLAAPTVGNERIFLCIIAGTSLAAEPSWNITYGAKTVEAAGPTWMEVTGRAFFNGDYASTTPAASVSAQTVVLGQTIKDTGLTGGFICTTGGLISGAEPTWNVGAVGNTTAWGAATFTYVGVPTAYAAWANPMPRQRIVGNSGFMAPGNNCWVSQNHAETQASQYTLAAGANAQGYNTQPLSFICANDSAAPPTAVATGASISTTGANDIITTNPFWAYFYGINCNAGSGASQANFRTNTSANSNVWFDTCGIKLNNTSSSSVITLNQSASGFVQYLNCNFVFGNASQQVNPGYPCLVAGGSFAATGTVPTTLFTSGITGQTIIRDCDLSAITGTIMNLSTANSSPGTSTNLQNCKLGSGVAIAANSNTAGPGGPFIKAHNCDNAATNYRYYYAYYFGTVQQETTIVRSSGATNGTTPESWNITTNSSTNYWTPFVSEEIELWQDTTGSAVTATFFLTSNTALNNNDVWLEVEYPSSASNPLGTVVTTRMVPLGTPAALTSDSSTWGGSITNKYKIAATFTPQMKGPVKCRIYVAKPSITIYVDPLFSISGVTSNRQYFVPGFGYINETGSAGGGGVAGPIVCSGGV